MNTSKFLAVVTTIVLALALLTGAIAAPILFRAFYYAHIGPLHLVERTGYTEEEIKTAFNEMMDFCISDAEFSTGVLKWSESGKSHFTDVRGLFQLDLIVLIGCLTLLIVLVLLSRQGVWPALLRGRGPFFWAGAGLGGVFLIVGALAALDFDRAFVVFHALFFPGKTNWLFDPREDQIINILPQEFFRNCAILVLAILVIGCAAFLAYDFVWVRTYRKASLKPRKF